MSDILVTLSTFAEHSEEPLKLLESSGRSFSVNSSGRRMLPEEVVASAGDSVGLVAGVEKYTAETLKQLPKLKVISRVGVGIDNIDLSAAEELGVRIVNTPDEPADAVAELTVMMMLGLLRRAPRVNREMRAGNWQRVTGNLLKGKTVGIVGLGRIGKRVVECLSGFGVKVVANDLYPDADWCETHGVTVVGFEELLDRADVVSLHASAGVSMGKTEISAMKKGGFLLNLARGEMVEEEALLEGLSSGHLAGAGLDVFSEEPYSGKLVEMENVLLSPHQSTLTTETRSSMELNAVKNLLSALGAA